MLEKKNSLEHNFKVCQHLLKDNFEVCQDLLKELKCKLANEKKYIINEKLQHISTGEQLTQLLSLMEVCRFAFLLMVARNPLVLAPLPVMLMSIVTDVASKKKSHEPVLCLSSIFQSFFILAFILFMLSNIKKLNDLSDIVEVQKKAEDDIEMLKQLSELQCLDCRSMSWIFYNMMKNNDKLQR